MNCPLCHQIEIEIFQRDRLREYLRCPKCDLIFVPERYHLSPQEEKSRYDFHQNDPNDSRYRTFLTPLFQALEHQLQKGAHGLDFGCGPGPTLSVMFAEAGYPCSTYDLYYARNCAVFKEKYDFLTCSEAMEHFRRPRTEFERFLKVVKPGGWMGIMTQLHDEAPVPFERWHYKKDDTHICFFSRRTFQTLGETYRLHVEFHAHNVILFRN